MKMNALLVLICAIPMQNAPILWVHTLVTVDMDFLVMDKLVLKSTSVLMDLINVVPNLYAPITKGAMTAVVQSVTIKKVEAALSKTSVLVTHVHLEANV